MMFTVSPSHHNPVALFYFLRSKNVDYNDVRIAENRALCTPNVENDIFMEWTICVRT